jgi:hypothetical protein
MGHFLKPGDRERLEQIRTDASTESVQLRAEILLDLDAGRSAAEIAAQRTSTVQRVLHWRREYLKEGLRMFPQVES